jgi:hypothetical protein
LVVIGGNEIKIGNERRIGGSLAWRTNNPGNVSWSGIAKQYGAIGAYRNPNGPDEQQRGSGIAIMPTEQAGIELKKALWRRPMYMNKTIDGAIQQWAEGAKKQGYGSNYARDMASAAGATLDTMVSSLTDRQLQSMIIAQRRWEGWKPGKIVSAADGGMFSGPKSGYPATLHGAEAVIPLKNGEVPVNIDNKDADQLQKEVRNLTANVIRLTQKDVMAPGGIGPTFAGYNEFTGFNQGPMTTDLNAVKDIAASLGGFDKATETITNPETWKKILNSGIAMNYDLGITEIGTKLVPGIGAEIGERLKEIQAANKSDLGESLKQVLAEFRSAMSEGIKGMSGGDDTVAIQQLELMTMLVREQQAGNDLSKKMLQASRN